MHYFKLGLSLAAVLVTPMFSQAAKAENAAARGILSRFAQAQAASFVLEAVPDIEGRDVYEIESTGGKIVLRGNSGVAQASAFYHYLKEYCHAHVSWNGDHLNLPAVLPPVPEKIHVVSPVKHRMAYN